MAASLADLVEKLSKESRELYLCEEVPRLEGPPSALEFVRDWVSPNLPVIIQGGFDQWPARKKWTVEYLKETVGWKEVTVAVTPNGYADAVVGDKFVMPEERLMMFSEFLEIIEKKVSKKGVFYVQKQDSNFTEEFSEIIQDASEDIPWATEAFGKRPDAVNFWMGEDKAITSLHKDHYENLYCVISGTKTFTLMPPTDLPFIPYEVYQPAKYTMTSSDEFEIIDLPPRDTCGTGFEAGALVPWIPVDPLKPDLVRFPQFAKARPVVTTVHAGEMLYLPSLWFHHVQQSHGCIAINFWYDMEFDIKYNYFKFLEGVSKLHINWWSPDFWLRGWMHPCEFWRSGPCFHGDCLQLSSQTIMASRPSGQNQKATKIQWDWQPPVLWQYWNVLISSTQAGKGSPLLLWNSRKYLHSTQ